MDTHRNKWACTFIICAYLSVFSYLCISYLYIRINNKYIVQREIFKIDSLGQYLLLNDQQSIFPFFPILSRLLVKQSAVSSLSRHFISIDVSHFSNRHYVVSLLKKKIIYFLSFGKKNKLLSANICRCMSAVWFICVRFVIVFACPYFWVG